eukprot:639257-Hanusia_phi.AAC.1
MISALTSNQQKLRVKYSSSLLPDRLPDDVIKQHFFLLVEGLRTSFLLHFSPSLSSSHPHPSLPSNLLRLTSPPPPPPPPPHQHHHHHHPLLSFLLLSLPLRRRRRRRSNRNEEEEVKEGKEEEEEEEEGEEEGKPDYVFLVTFPTRKQAMKALARSYDSFLSLDRAEREGEGGEGGEGGGEEERQLRLLCCFEPLPSLPPRGRIVIDGFSLQLTEEQ